MRRKLRFEVSMCCGTTLLFDGLEWSNQLSLPQPQVLPKLAKKNLINLQPLWDKGIKGQGQVSCDWFRSWSLPTMLFNGHQQQIKSEADIEAAKKKAGITHGGWYNDKVVYVHNYSDMDDNVKEEDPISHGSCGWDCRKCFSTISKRKFFRGGRSSQSCFCVPDTKGGQVQNFTYTSSKLWKTLWSLGPILLIRSLGTASGPSMMLVKSPVKLFDEARKAEWPLLRCFYQYGNQWRACKPLCYNTWLRDDWTPSVNSNVIAASINSLTKHVSTEASFNR